MDELTPESPQYLRRINAVLALREIPDYPAALEQAEKALEEAPAGDANVYLVRGLVHRDLGQRDKAEEDFRDALGLEPDWEPIREALASLMYSQSRYNEVIRLVQAPINSGTAGPELWYLYTAASLGNPWFSTRRDVPKTFAAIRKKAETAAADQSEGHARIGRIHQALAEYYLAARAPDAALSAAESGLAVVQRDQALLRLRVAALLNLGRYADALELITQLQEEGVDGLHWDEYVARLGTGNIERAHVIAAQHHNDRFSELTRAVYRLQEHGFATEAAAGATHLFEYGAVHPEDLVWMLFVLAEGGEAAHAEEIVRYLMERIPDFGVEPPKGTRLVPPGLDELVRYLLEWYEEEFELVILLRVALAYILLRKGAYDEAAAQFAEVAERAAGGEYYPIELDFLAVAFNEDDAELTKLPPASSHDPTMGPADFYACLATAYSLAGEKQKALAAAETAVSMAPDESASYAVYAVLGCVHRSVGNWDAARTAWEQGLATLVEGEDDIEEARALLGEWIGNLDDDEAPENEFSG